MASFSFNRTIKLNNVVYRQISQTEWLNTQTNQKLSSTSLSLLITASKTKQTITPPSVVRAQGESFYNRIIKIAGTFYKQISASQWQNMSNGQIFSNISNLLYLTILQTKDQAQAAPVTPSGGVTGACCEIVNGIMECSIKTQESCSNGCFKPGVNCNVTEENPNSCTGCVHCCIIGSGCLSRTPSACLLAGGTYFSESIGCTGCKFGVCSSDTTITERFYGNGCTGIFIEGGGVASFDVGVYCTGSGVGQTCFGSGYRYQETTPTFIVGGTCADCIYGACCTGGTCAGITSESSCVAIGGLFFAGSTCSKCDYGVYCSGLTTNRTCLGFGYRGQELSEQFQTGVTCSYCITGTCCVDGTVSFGDNVRQSNCIGKFFGDRFAPDACATGSCCVDSTCNENIFRYDCIGVFNAGMTCIACSSGSCCLPSGGCTLTTMTACMATGGTFFGGATCAACDTGVCCYQGQCTNQRRGNGCLGNFYPNITCGDSPCVLGACCVGGTCISSIESKACELTGGVFFGGQTCIACATGANCLTDLEQNGDRSCVANEFLGNVFDGTFYPNQGCSACQTGVCCDPLGGGTGGIRGDCTGSKTFYAGQTLFACDAGIFCTGSGVGQTCFGFGHRGQSLTNTFIAGGTCASCILGACCTGGTCYGGTLTSQATCNSVGGLFYAGATCRACDYGVYCSGITCSSLGYRAQALTANFIQGATCSACILGACCTGGGCSGSTYTSQANCSSGLFYPGATCRACDYGVYCTGGTCGQLGYRAQALTSNFIQGATCSACILGACCTGGTCAGGGQTAQRSCVGGTFYAGATCSTCVTGVFCTGSGVGQTCFGIGHIGQSFTNNFIAGATCSACILGVCCTGGTCYGGTLTSQAICSNVGGLFFAGATCDACVYGVYCTGADESTSCVRLGYKAENLSNRFTIAGNCTDDCVYGSCCDGTTCLGITNQGNCPKPYAFFEGHTCSQCDTGQGACCTGGSSSITTVSGCQSLGGIFFPEGTTALCVTGSCCTGGTCTTEISGRSGNCQLFIEGATCGICDTGVYCTGATCQQTGFRGQSLTNVFISGATCSACIQGICCTGGTCIGGGQTAQINCPPNVGTFVSGATTCSACANNITCCLPGGTCSYMLRENCIAQNGIPFESGSTLDCLLCQEGAFCGGRTCIGVTLFGFNLGETFISEGDCSYCIYGTCCEDEVASDTTQNDCKGTFYPGDFNSDICTAGLTYGICCNGTTCTSGILQTDCTGFFVDENTAMQNNLSCETNACELGICCKEGAITSVTGGVCLGEMTRAECALTGGDFFALTTGATCTNCLYIPMLASALTEKFASNTTEKSYGTTSQFNASVTGFTGNQIQPRLEQIVSEVNTWITSRDRTLYGSGATTSISFITRETFSGSPSIKHLYRNYAGFTAWYDNTLSLKSPSNSQYLVSEISGGTFDYSPVLGTGRTNSAGLTLGYHAISGSTLNSSGIVRYMRLVLGYGNPSDSWYDTVLVYRAATNASQAVSFYLRDATRHAGLNELTQNQFPSTMPFTESPTDTTYSSPVLIQMFSENPLKYRVRPVGSCCVGATCIGIVTKDHCAFKGGTFHENALCGRCYPTLIYGNCCVGGTHAGYTTFANCNKISGTFFEGPTYSADACVYGTICTEDRQCYQGISASYYGAFSSTNNKFFIQQNFGSTLGCAACDAGLCCVGGTCMGVKSKTDCTVLGGTIYYDENKCETNCELGVCCETGVTCGTYTNRANCTGYNKVFIDGATLGATCSACSSYLTLTSYSSGVTFTMILNQGTTYGTFQDGSYWVQEKNNLKLLDVKLEYPNATGTTLFKYKANTRLSGLTLTAAGYQGSVYIHGIDKNPLPEQYIHPVQGFTSGNKQGYMSINYNDYDEGWAGSKSIGATDNPNEYDGFDLLKFLNFQNLLKYQGLTLAAGDVVLANASNFDPTKATFPSNAGGYAYQVQKSRANTLSYGVLNCLSATGAALAGSTLCFRPPVSWLPEDLVNRPLYPMSRLDGKIPGQPGNTLTNVGTSAVDTNLKYSNVINQAKSLSQTSEFSNAVSYGVVTPMWGMFGARVLASSYGEQYIIPLQQIIQVAYAKNSVGTSLTTEQRKDLIARIAQYGLDSWGGHRLFATCMGSGAGQKAGRTRSWIPLAGYYLGETAMYDPEATMLSDTQRLNKFIESNYTSNSVRTPGGTCASEAEWRIFRYGTTGPENNYAGLRRAIARAMSHEVNTMIEYVNAPSNLVRHYEYFGSYYRDTNFSGFTTNGATGITFYNEFRSNFPVDSNDTKRVVVSGNFGVMRFGSGTAAPNPFPGRFNAGTKEGSGPSWQGGWMRVISGPGSSGGAGSRYYKVLQSTGFRSDSDTAPSNLGGGYQIVLGQTWADGIPNHTSVLKFYPAGPVDGGITRPSTFHELGYTYGPIGFLINNNPSSSCASTDAKTDSILFDGSLGAGHNPYFGNSLDAWADQYLLTDYIMKTKGITLISDIAPMPDYIRTYVLTSPYNLTALFTWYSGTSSVWNTWLGISGSWNSASFMTTKINFKNHFPGIVNWRGVTIT